MRWRRALAAALMVAAVFIALAQGMIAIAALIVLVQFLLFALPGRWWR